jgi:hypothetical protein
MRQLLGIAVQREVNDANTFANVWKIDMLKYDACRYNMGTVRVFRQGFTLEEAIGSHAFKRAGL